MRKTKVQISLYILLAINMIFAYKYLHRISNFSFLISATLIFFQYLIFQFKNKLPINPKWISIFFLTTLISTSAFVLFVWIKIPVESLNIDRYSIINSFLDEALKGNYPYFAKSFQGNIPGPMPTYFLIAFPFYLVGELCILSFIGFGLIYYVIYRRNYENSNVTFLLFYFLTSTYVYWEIAARSNIFTITVLILLLMNYFLQLNKNDKLKLYLFSLTAGILLSTRSVYFVVFVVFFLSDLINKQLNLKQFILVACFGFIGFFLTFLPLLVFFKTEFLIMNPFNIQTSHFVPQEYNLVFIIIAIALSFGVKNNADKFFMAGLSLFIPILIYSLYNISQQGISNAYLGNSLDISYFIFCVPFFVFYLLKYESKGYTT